MGMFGKHGSVWEAGETAEDSQGRRPMENLKKYLLKVQYFANSVFTYWLNASRFYTYSQSLLMMKTNYSIHP
jgi:hypothetical protein